MIKIYNQNLSDRQIAEILNVSEGYVTQRRNKLYLPYNKEKIFTHIDLIDKNVILIHKDSYEYLSGKLIKTIQHNYNKVVYTKTVAQTENYLLFEMKQK